MLWQNIRKQNQQKKSMEKVSNDKVYTNANLFFDKKKNRELPNIRPSLHFYGMIILVKKKVLYIGMAWLPFQKSYLPK